MKRKCIYRFFACVCVLGGHKPASYHWWLMKGLCDKQTSDLSVKTNIPLTLFAAKHLHLLYVQTQRTWTDSPNEKSHANASVPNISTVPSNLCVRSTGAPVSPQTNGAGYYMRQSQSLIKAPLIRVPDRPLGQETETERGCDCSRV